MHLKQISKTYNSLNVHVFACLTTLMQTYNEMILITTYTDENPSCRRCLSVDTFC